MKVIIPVAGAGAKLRPFTYTQPKCLIPLAGKTILSFIIDELLDAGVNEFIFIIGHLGEKIKDYVVEKYPTLNVQFLTQIDRDGTGHAIYLAKDLIAANEEVVIVFGDTVCDNQIAEVIKNNKSCLGIKRVDDPRSFGVVELNDAGKVIHTIEKPTVPKSNLALVGLYKIKESQLLFDVLKDGLKQNTKDEKYSLTQAIDSMLQKGVEFSTINLENWYDCGKKESLLNTNASILKKLEFASDEVPFFDNTIILHPVSIADGCNIQNSIIGPNVTIGENTNVESSIIADSIIGSFSELNKVVLHKSLIGNDAIIKGYSQSLNIGDNTEIDFQV
jgi:glucose-1-phosphate thymidylyltransferase